MKELQELVDMLLARQAAIEFMLVGLALAVAENGRTPLPKVLDALEFMRVFSRVTESKDVADGFDATLARLRAAQDASMPPRAAFVLFLARFASERPHLREALKTWLSMATPEELADDLRELLDRLSGES